MELIRKYFPDIDDKRYHQFEMLFPLYEAWNSKINLVSRKDFTFFYERHVLHSLAIAKLISFPEGCRIMDAGTGGGFPGIPLAIFFPGVHFHLVDSIQKKITAVESIASDLGLQNVTAKCSRLENLTGKYHYITSRAVAPLQQMIRWISHLQARQPAYDPPCGMLYLKGGEVDEELIQLNRPYQLYKLSNLYSEPYFETKVLIHFPA